MKMVWILAALLLSSEGAHAFWGDKYECKELNQGGSWIQVSMRATRVGVSANVNLHANGAEAPIALRGYPQSPEEQLLGKYSLVDVDANPADLFFQESAFPFPAFCGRAGCDDVAPEPKNPEPKIIAKLQYLGSEKSFSCEAL